MTSNAVPCTTEQTELGEGTRWDERYSELLRVDILAGRVYRDKIDNGAGRGHAEDLLRQDRQRRRFIPRSDP